MYDRNVELSIFSKYALEYDEYIVNLSTFNHPDKRLHLQWILKNKYLLQYYM